MFQHNGGPLFLGIYKESQATQEDWVVIDNFRLSYYGKDTTVDDVTSGVETVDVPEINRDGRIYNLMGVEVKNPTASGIYIRNGKKFIIK